jgi:hypothetical protein
VITRSFAPADNVEIAALVEPSDVVSYKKAVGAEIGGCSLDELAD